MAHMVASQHRDVLVWTLTASGLVIKLSGLLSRFLTTSLRRQLTIGESMLY